jgi:hypothetical protein
MQKTNYPTAMELVNEYLATATDYNVTLGSYELTTLGRRISGQKHEVY